MTAPAPAEDEKPDLSAQLDDIISKAQSIVDTATAAGRELSPDEDREHRALTDRAEKIGETINRNHTLARIRSAAVGNGRHLRIEHGAAGSDETYDRDGIGAPESIDQPRTFRNPWDMSTVQMFGRSRSQVAAELRARALSAIEKMPSANDKIREAGTRIVERFDDKHATIARTALAASHPAYMSAFGKIATGRQAEINEPEQRAMEEVRALSLTDSAGGLLVPFQLDPTVIVSASGSLNDIRQIARTVVATGDVWNGVTAGAVAWSWDAEATEVSDDSPTFAQPSIPVHKAQGWVPVSIEALQDMANGAQEIARLLAEGRDVLEAAAFAIGSGVGQPVGIITALAGSGSIIPAATADTLTVADIYNTSDALPARYRRNASWLATNKFYSRARQFDQSGGSSLWAQLGDDRPNQLLGKPVYEAEDMDGTINAGLSNYLAVFGDFSNYIIADRLGMTIEMVPTVFGPSGRPTGQRGWHAYYRTGANVVNANGLRMLDI